MSLRVVKALGLTTIQDFGRPGRMHEGLPQGGALVRSLLVRANRLAHNPDDAAGIEVLGRLVVRAETHTAVATDTAPLRVLTPGEQFEVSCAARRAAYLAVRGGVNAPLVLGSRGAHLSAGIGNLLRPGALITSGQAACFAVPPDPFQDDDVIRVVAGPDRIDTTSLTSAPYTILPASDRVGTRLHGPAILAAGLDGSRPMLRGAIEVPGDGQPIVLGPEHPTTGGYPIVAVIATDQLDRFFARPAGSLVRFVVR